jgi:hypothetical protein
MTEPLLDLDQLLNLDTQSLLEQLGTYDAKGATARDRARKGQEILRNATAHVRNTICTNPDIRELHAKYSSSRPVLIVAAIIDLIAPIFIKTSPALIAVLLFKEGLSSLCDVQWRAKEDAEGTPT